MNQAKPNDADAFDDLLGQLVDELAMTRRAAPEPEPDQAVLLGIAKPAPTITPDAGGISVDSAWGGNDIPEPKRKSLAPYLAIGGGLFAAVLGVGIYAVNTLGGDSASEAAGRNAPTLNSAGAPPPIGSTMAQIPDPTATSSSTATDTASSTDSTATASDSNTTTTEAAAEPAKSRKRSTRRKKRPAKPKKPASKKKDSFDDL